MAGPKPSVPSGYNIYLDAFYSLGSERQVVQGIIGSIPVMKIIEYGNYFGIENINLFHTVINEIDIIYVNTQMGQIRKATQT